MKSILKKIITPLIIKLIFLGKNIKVDSNTTIALSSIKTLRLNKCSKKFPSTIQRSIIGDLRMGDGCRITSSVVVGEVEIERFVSINGPGTRLSGKLNGISIGSFTSIASNVVIQEEYHNYQNPSSYFIMKNIFNENIKSDINTKGKIIIEEDVWVGSNSVILSGVKIGRGAIIGAGSVVTKNVPPYSIYAGNPARLIRMRFTNEEIHYLENSQWWKMGIDQMLKNKEFFNTPVSEQVLRKRK
ncbi:CatB-related O-acetyltransferase [Bacillus solitudinis]|uniref:CatB-related O-acetyltransferase n=1 Tax=Bacillus solitudinis TaxID=2014074 RepID=UPI000C23DFCE|nr:CatB-related O-acetyltransferase [Bacillus solitudinis]